MRLRAIGFAAALMLAAMCDRASAGVVIDVRQIGSDVVATGSGTLDTTDLTFQTQSYANRAAFFPDLGGVVLGPASSTAYDLYSGVTGPTSLGSASAEYASSGSGDFIGVQGNGGYLGVPVGYASGTSLSATSTWDNTTIAGLGLTPGTYTYTWGSGADADSITLKISSVPEPSTLVIGGIALAVWVIARRRQPAGARGR